MDKTNFNSAIIVDATIDSENKTVKAVLSEETKVIRYNYKDGVYDLILDHSENAIDFSRKDIMPVLLQHNDYSLPIGIWENVRLEDGKVKAMARFDSEDSKAMEIFGKIERNIMKSFSVGIQIDKQVLIEENNENGRKTYKATKWQLQEASVVTIPAIPNAKVGLSEEDLGENPASAQIEKKIEQEKSMKTVEEFKSQYPDLYTQVFSAGVAGEKDRVNAHIEMAKSTGADKFALECIEGSESLSQTVIAKYTAFGLNNQQKKDRENENLGNVETPQENLDNGKDEESAKQEAKEQSLAKVLNVDLSKVKGA